MSLILVGACGGSTATRGEQPSWRGSQQAPKQTSAAVEFLELRPTATASTHYNALPLVTVPQVTIANDILKVVEQASLGLGKAAPVPDGRLYRALNELAEVTPVDTPITYSLIEFALQRNGIIEPSPHLVIIWGDINQPEDIITQLSERLGTILSSGRFSRVGIGTASRGEDGDVILLAFQESHLTTKSVPRELASAGTTSIEGSVAQGFTDTRVFHTDEEGAVHKLEIAGIGGHGFRVHFGCATHHGRQQLEITAADTLGSTVLANFPIWCGTKAPSSMKVSTRSSDPTPKTRVEAEERMLVLLNEDRAKQKLPALALQEQLTGIARLHSDEMLETGQVAHVSARTGSAADRVKVGGVRTAVVLENVARAYGVVEAQQGLMNSPGHRANILSSDVTHVGIGITLGEEVSGRRELLVTQVFTYVPPVIDPARMRARAQARIRKLKAMRVDADLQAIAQTFAQSIAKGESAQVASKRASKDLDINRGGFERVSTLVTTVADVSSFNPEGALGSASVQYMGVGVAQGDHPVMGDGAIYIVVLLGER